MFELDVALETELELDGVIYLVNMAFDNILKLFKILDSPLLNDYEKICFGIKTLLGTELELAPQDQVEVFHYLLDNFVNQGSKKEVAVDLGGNPMPVKRQAATQDLKHDASYIYNSFRQAYRINLFEEQGKLDWREFLSLLRGLPDDTEYKKIIDIRTRPYQKGKGVSEANRKLREAKRAYALPGVEVE